MQRYPDYFRAVLFFVVFCWHSVINAATVTVVLESTKDHSIFSDSQSGTSYKRIYSGIFNSGVEARSLLQFDITGKIPERAVIDRVVIGIHAEGTAFGSNVEDSLRLHNLTNFWREYVPSALPQKYSSTTWTHNSPPLSLWTIPGGDYDPPSANSARLVRYLTQPGDPVWLGPQVRFVWDSDDGHVQMIEDVRQWRDGEYANNGWIIISDASVVTLYSKESDAVVVDPGFPNLPMFFPPKLFVTFTVTDPQLHANAGPDRWVSFDESADLDGDATIDSSFCRDLDVSEFPVCDISYQWECVQGCILPGICKLEDNCPFDDIDPTANGLGAFGLDILGPIEFVDRRLDADLVSAANPQLAQLTAPPRVGSVVLRLTVTNALGQTDSDEVVINVLKDKDHATVKW